ncbi:hypothetical protein [Candidatus Flexifilum breve]|uniref:hypothetical protein n=1 Tax=Candidatus Flexifilum breve TaxID=3140694 RepID=UPI0031CCC519
MATTTVRQEQAASSTLVTSVVQGITAALIGGSVFGVQMAVGGMLPMVAQLVGSQNPVVGFVMHLIISAIIGAVYGAIAPRLPAGWLVAMGAGIVYGVIWWVLGALVMMPLLLGMGDMVFQIGDMQLMSLIGHVIFGIITAGFFTLIQRR